jgi:hypothetical protein
MDIVDALRKCIARERSVVATFEHDVIEPYWESHVRLAPREQGLVVLGCLVDGESQWTPMELIVGCMSHGTCSPYMLTFIPPRQSYALALHERARCGRVEPGTIELLGWTLDW